MTRTPLDLAQRNLVVGQLNADDVPPHFIDDALIDQFMPQHIDGQILTYQGYVQVARALANTGLTPAYQRAQQLAVRIFTTRISDLQALRAQYP